MSTENLEFLAFGRTLKTMTPSGRIFTIREQNGNDDDLLSNTAAASDLTNIDNFLTSIVLSETINDKECSVKFETITKLPNNDRYHLLIASRVHSLGPIMKFGPKLCTLLAISKWYLSLLGNLVIASRVHSLGPIMKFDYEFEEGVPISFEEDLSKYLHDYTKPFPEIGEEDYFKYKIPPYPANSDITSIFSFTTTSGKNLSFGLMTRVGEKFLLTLTPEQHTRNSELKARNLQLFQDGVPTKVENFSIFSKLDMVEIHKAIQEVDPSYSFASEIQNPKTRAVIKFPLMFSPSFFFPVEV